MHSKLLAAFDRHAIATFDKQLYLSELVGTNSWQFDMDQGTLSFGKGQSWKVQVLGTQSDQTGTWQWAWSNTASKIPANLLSAANSLRKFGTEQKIPELTTAKQSAQEHDGHFWATLATGSCKAKAYYRGPYQGGAVFLLITDPGYPWRVEQPLARLLKVLPQALAALEINNHREALLGHAALLGLVAQPQGSALTIADNQGGRLSAEFDAHHQLVKLSGDGVTLIELVPQPTSNPPASVAAANAPGGHSQDTSLEAPQTKRTVRRSLGQYVRLWLHHCQLNFVSAALIWGAVTLLIWLAVWAFTSTMTASVVAAVVFSFAWWFGFHPTDSATDPRYLHRRGLATIWTSTLPTLESLAEYLAAKPHGFADDAALAPIDPKGISWAVIQGNLSATINKSVRGTITDPALPAAIAAAERNGARSIIVYHDLDYPRLIVPQAVNAAAPLALLGTFEYGPADDR